MAEETDKFITRAARASTKNVYHTDPDCRTLKVNESGLRHPTTSEIQYHELTRCQYCDPEVNVNDKRRPDWGAYNRASGSGEEAE